MRLTRSLLTIAINFSIVLPAIIVTQTHTVNAQTANTALQRGYRTGYSDGYMAGYRDSIDSLARSMSRHREFEAADRAYNKDYGSLEDYRDGYRQGFQSGYDTGFEKRTFESTAPPDLGRKGISSAPVQAVSESVAPAPIQRQPVVDTLPPPPVVQSDAASDNTTPVTVDPPANNAQPRVIRKASYSDDVIVIAKDTEIVLQLEKDLSTENTRAGERFTARVVSPMELDGAIVEGHIEKVLAPGRIKRRSELQLSFDRIVLNDNRWSNFNGLLVEVVPVKGDNVRRVTDEGTAVGQSSIKGDVVKIGASTGAGAGIGAIAGGPVGAAVGAGIGAAFGVGAAFVDRGKHIRLNKNQQLRIRSSYETQIR